MSSLIIDNDAQIFKMWYAGGRGTERGIGYATSNIGEIPVGISVERGMLSGGAEIYPNPANDMITVKTNSSERHTLKIVTINGQLIYSAEKSVPSYTIDRSSYEKGVYFITIRSQISVTTEKIIILQ